MNELRLIGTIGSPGLTSQEVKAELAAMDDSQPLELHIDSNGGSVIQGFSIHNALKEYAGRITAIIEPAAFSIASYITMAADEIQIAANGFVMLHKPMVDAQGADEDDLAKNLKLVQDIKASMVAAYAQRSGMTPEAVTAMLEKETFWNATESVAKGFADSILGESVPSSFSLTAFSLPEPVAMALAKGGKPDKEPEMAAATIKEIQDRFPTANAEFVLDCVKAELQMPDVAEKMVEQVNGDNAELTKRLELLEAENAELKTAQTDAAEAEAKAKLEAEVAAKAKEEATAKGADPVANVVAGSKETATAEWKDAIAAEVKSGLPKTKAVQVANRKNPGLRERYLEEANA